MTGYKKHLRCDVYGEDGLSHSLGALCTEECCVWLVLQGNGDICFCFLSGDNPPQGVVTVFLGGRTVLEGFKQY